MVTQNKKQENDQPAAPKQNHNEDLVKPTKKSSVKSEENSGSFFDLRTTHGQILFLFISITVSALVQLLPNDTLKNIIFNNSNDRINQSNTNLGCNVSTAFTSIPAAFKRPTYWLYGKNKDESHLRHVKFVLRRLGYDQVTNESLDWDLLWAHDYPFRSLYPKLHHLKSHQRINHFPGCGFLTNKVDLATTDLKYIPKSFKLPENRDEFMEYSKLHQDKLFVQKHNQHRHIYIKSVKEIDFADNDTFLQEYVDNPLLVDGHKFDIGVYVIITSIDPLRVYIYKGDILFRYCPVKYYPFDSKNVDKYIVGDDYLPTWDIPSLSPFYNGLGFGMKDSFDAYLRSKARDPSGIWPQVEDAIRLAILSKEKYLTNTLSQYRYKRNFFEMMRFDLVIDNDLKVFLMEANMSPNLSSAHFLQNTLLYEQVIYNLLNLVGVGSSVHRESLRRRTSDAEQMMSSDKNIAVNAEHCSNPKCSESCEPSECELCRPCLSSQDVLDLHTAYREHVNRGDTKRIFPKPLINNEQLNEDELRSLSPKNQMITKWFAGKCAMESSWCF